MSNDGYDNAERDERLSKVLAACLEAIDQGEPLDAQEWLARYPEFAAELAQLIAGQEHIGRFTKPLCMGLREADTPHRDETPRPGDEATRAAGPWRGGLRGIFGDYEMLRELGCGGMGVACEARQRRLQCNVALKMLRRDRPISAVERQRFQAEAEAIAALDHPHIVPIYEVGELEGQAFFCMKLVRGGSLAEHLPRFSADGRAAARLLARIARAVHDAHQRGVLHRDLKPSNILLDSDGLPYVTDFGLAKRLESGADLTQSGAIVGTPGYMAPEQATGKKETITTAADVYGLGAVLYALLTGRPPFTGETPLDTLTKVREQEPESPSNDNPRVDRELEAICLKCLEKEPRRRYASAEALADDLERWLNGEPIQARAVGRLERLGRWCRRNPVVAGLTAMTAALLVLVVVFALRERSSAIRQRDDAREQQARVEEREAALRRQMYIADVELASQAWRNADLRVMRERLARQLPQPGQEDLRGFEWHYLWRVCHSSEPWTLRGHEGEVGCAAYSPDGQTLATAGQDGTVRLWQVASRELRAVLRGHTGTVLWVSFAADGRTLTSIGADCTLRRWDRASGLERDVLALPYTGFVHAALTPDDRLLALALADNTVRLWDVRTRTERPRPGRGQFGGHGSTDRPGPGRKADFFLPQPEGPGHLARVGNEPETLWGGSRNRTAIRLRELTPWVLSPLSLQCPLPIAVRQRSSLGRMGISGSASFSLIASVALPRTEPSASFLFRRSTVASEISLWAPTAISGSQSPLLTRSDASPPVGAFARHPFVEQRMGQIFIKQRLDVLLDIGLIVAAVATNALKCRANSVDITSILYSGYFLLAQFTTRYVS
jgi:hypothetical protein